MRRLIALTFVVTLALACVTSVPARGSTFRQFAFSEIVSRAEVIVRGRVVGLRSFRTGAGGAIEARSKRGVPPRAAPAAQAAAAAPRERPVSAGIEGTGRMILTAVDLEVEDPIKGVSGSLVQFTIAGGTVDGVRAFVLGLPTFQMNDDVLLFLREGYQATGTPIVGANQGAFRIVNEAGGDVMLDAESQYVIGVENDRVITRRNARAALASTHRIPTILGPPVPDSSDVIATASREANRFWTSQEPPMEFASFRAAVSSRLKQ
jgi:hypothetical protein